MKHSTQTYKLAATVSGILFVAFLSLSAYFQSPSLAESYWDVIFMILTIISGQAWAYFGALKRKSQKTAS